MAFATTVHLIRHATYDEIGRGLAGRTPGLLLNEEGRSQSARLAANLRAAPIKAVIASPLERAKETASSIAQQLGLDLLTDESFIELDFGDWTGRAFGAIPRREWEAFNAARTTACPPGAGENLISVRARSVAGLKRLHERWPNEEIAVVTHGDVIRCVLAHALGMDLALFQRLTVDPASRSVVVVGDDFIRVDGMNLPPG